MKALCFGSLNIDYTYQVPHFVQPGETIASSTLQMFPGGKGLNQAIALARSGVQTWMAGAIGGDGRFLMDVLAEAGVHTELLVFQKEIRTGHAIIQRTPDGENAILLYGGANRCITADAIQRALEPFQAGDLLVVQNEINALEDVIAQAHARGMTVALNASPADEAVRELPSDQIDILMVNMEEARKLTGLPQDADRETVLLKIGAAYPQSQVVVTSGVEGAWFLRHGREFHQEARRVQSVDTTSAGDTFTGFYLGSLLQGSTMAQAAERASLAAAICVTRQGASPSIPTLAEVKSWQEMQQA